MIRIRKELKDFNKDVNWGCSSALDCAFYNHNLKIFKSLKQALMKKVGMIPNTVNN